MTADQLESSANANWFNKQEVVRVHNYATYDKVLVALSSGGLAATLAVMSELYKSQKVICELLIYAAITMLGFSIIVTLWNFLFAAHEAERSMVAGPAVDQDLDSSKLGREKTIKCLNILGGIFFCIGIVLLGTFICINFYHAQSQIAL